MSVRDWLLQKNQRRYKTVDINGQGVRIRSMTERERSEIDESQFDREENRMLSPVEGDYRGRHIVACVVDDYGQPVFTADDLPSLRDLDEAYIGPLYAAIREHVGLPSAKDKADLGNSSGGTGEQD